MDLGRHDAAEKIYRRALEDYEKAIGYEAVKTYIPGLSTFGILPVICRVW
jgi:hypothetical protein